VRMVSLRGWQEAVMPRQRRLDLPGVPQHVIRRGNNRQPCFLREQDYQCYLSQLGEATLACGCRIHAYVPLTNHIHLLMTPEVTGAVARTMQSLGRRYVGDFNASYRRSGTLWEGRYKSCLVDSER
jgi:putative transposase